MNTNYIIIILFILIIFFLIVLTYTPPKKSQKSNYYPVSPETQYYRTLNSFLDERVKSEFNEECLDDERRQCVLTDGSPGKCVLSGICASTFLFDWQDEANRDYKCLKPIENTGCTQFCNCLKLKGIHANNCKENCLSWYPPT